MSLGHVIGNAVNQFDPAKLVREMSLESAKQLVILTGAGASMEHPSHVPSGVELMNQALRDYFLPGVAHDLRNACTEIRKITGAPRSAYVGRPRLEAVLDVVATSYGAVALGHLTSRFIGREPNRVHRMLAAHLAAGGRQVTANFDRLIEHALEERAAIAPFHFHGSVEGTEDALPFGARLGEIEHGFNDADREKFLSALSAVDITTIAWFGYSFSDYFDATPALIGAINEGRFDGKNFLWFAHGSDAPHVSEIDIASEDNPAVLLSAHARGLRVVKIGGCSGDALFQLLKELECMLDDAWAQPESCNGSDLPLDSPFSAEQDAKVHATVNLLGRFGLIGRVGHSTENLGLSVEELPGSAAAEYWWKKGAYKKAFRASLETLDRTDQTYRIRRLLLGARIDWIRGRLIWAGIRVVAAIRLIDRETEETPELYVEALERFGRVAVHMARSLDTRFFPLWLLRRAVPDYVHRMSSIGKLAAVVSVVPIAHASDALQNYFREVGRIDRAADRPIAAARRRELLERFSEFESLDSYVDYVRGNANIGSWTFPVGPRTWQEQMAKLYTVVGNEADIHRMALLNSPRRDATLFDAVRAACALDVTGWQRLRMVVLFAVNRHRVRAPRT
ncbi:MAG: hypothetical protein KF692_11600 [Cryobacterium sp.]|nr:hypothetical protein [Cryobacterium sp.]